MDRDTLQSLTRAARERHGAVTGRTLRQEVLDSSLASELMLEQATTLGRLGAGLDAAVAALQQIREAVAARPEGVPTAEERAADRVARERLKQLRWELQVVQEAMGLRQVRAGIDRQWPVPPHLPADSGRG